MANVTREQLMIDNGRLRRCIDGLHAKMQRKRHAERHRDKAVMALSKLSRAVSSGDQRRIEAALDIGITVLEQIQESQSKAASPPPGGGGTLTI